MPSTAGRPHRKVWSVVCSHVARPYRGMGVQHRLLAAAIGFARDNGARMLEAFPVDKAERSPDYAMFFGSRSLYERVGFTEVVRRSPTRVVMRRAPRRGRSSSGEPDSAKTERNDHCAAAAMRLG